MVDLMNNKKETRNELMKRKEISLIRESAKNPTFAEASKMISDECKAAEDCIMVENIKGKFGRNTFLIKASVYDSKELKDEAFKRLTKPKKAAPGAAA